MRVLKILFAGVLIFLLALLVAPVVLFSLGVQEYALVQSVAGPTQDDVARLKQLLRDNDPRSLHDGQSHSFSISERDLNLGLRSVLPMAERQRSLVSLESGRGRLDYTFELPANPLGDYFNFSLLVAEQAGKLSVESVKPGQLTLPGWLFQPLFRFANFLLGKRFAEYQRADSALESVTIEVGELSVGYRWDKALAYQLEQRGRLLMLSGEDRERVLAYYQVLTRVSRKLSGNGISTAPLEQLLQPLFELALLRSTHGDAAAENRALLLMLGTVLNRSAMQRLVGGDPLDLDPGHHYVRWTLHGRNDLAQHFGVSAAIAAAGGGVLADAIGVFKELDDSRGGSGFSFADLLADRSGVELALAASGQQAQEVQLRLASNQFGQAGFMPPIDHLPEGIQELEFKQRFSDLDDERYALVNREVETRISALALYQ
jgi:hypothetical protein